MSRCYISHSASQEMSYQKSVIFQFFSAKPKDLISWRIAKGNKEYEVEVECEEATHGCFNQDNHRLV